MTTVREMLRDLPVLPPELPAWEVGDLSTLPTEPHLLFEAWLTEAVGAGTQAPHAMTLATADTAGRVAARTVILKDLTADGWWFAGHAGSPKGRDLTANPQAALVFLWPETGSQVRVTGPVRSRPDVGATDFLARPAPSRAAGLVNHQSDVLDDLATHRKAWADALQRVTDDPDLVTPSWTAWALDPTSVEFWRSGTGTGQTRVRYRRASDGSWARELLWP